MNKPSVAATCSGCGRQWTITLAEPCWYVAGTPSAYCTACHVKQALGRAISPATSDPINRGAETAEERAEREAAGLAPGEEWECWWERCWFCPHALKTVEENVAGVCTSCQAQGRIFPARPVAPAAERAAQALAVLQRLVREEVARRPATPETPATPATPEGGDR